MTDRLKLLLTISCSSFLFLLLSLIFPSVSVSFVVTALILLAYDIYLLVLMLADASFDWYSVPSYVLFACTAGLAQAVKSATLGMYLAAGCFAALSIYYFVADPDQIRPK